MTTDVGQARSALLLLRDRSSATIDVLQQSPDLSQARAALLSLHPTSAVLHKDFQSLLTLIYASTTKVSLVLRPSAPAPSAALTSLSDLATCITSLATCATLFDLHGGTLGSEARLIARDVCEAVRALADAFVDNAGEDYLVRTGAVHDHVEKARRELPVDNLAAVKKRWKADRGMMDDCIQEIDGLVEGVAGAGEEDMGGEDYGIDDEWDELGFGSSNTLSDTELERVKKVQPLVRFVTLFHKRVVPDVFGAPSPSTEAGVSVQNAALDVLPPLSNALLLALEEVVATLYAPQKPDALVAAVTALVEVVHGVHKAITADVLMHLPQPPLPSQDQADLSREMGALRIDAAQPTSGGEKKEKKTGKDAREWFGSCLAQIDKSAKGVGEMVTAQITANVTVALARQ